MNDATLLELADRWDKESETPETTDGSDEAKVPNAVDQGHRECKRECADTLRTLIEILGTPVGMTSRSQA